jgi:alpha-glucuronidase
MRARLWCWLLTLAALTLGSSAQAEDGYDAWLRYARLNGAALQGALAHTSTLVGPTQGASALAAEAELERGLTGITGRAPARSQTLRDGAILLATPASHPGVLPVSLAGLGDEGYAIRTSRIEGKTVTLIAANKDIGLLYGAFALLRLAGTGADLAHLDLRSAPRVKLRVLNHWDNLDGTVERGYAGASIWDWWHLPDWRDPRYTDYARLNASIGINGTVLNNVNAKADSLTAPYIAKAAALAAVFRPYGIRVYLSAKWSAPIEIGGLKSADPLDPQVAAWWATKADEIYAAIPDFGGFLVKANSEGQPGPQDYHRTHADGANMLAAALKPHGGVVMWRAFVYAHGAQANPKLEDRAKQAYDDFKPLDGQFADNVIVQVKNGAIDFQPREPFHPLFGAMPKTPLMMEFQITKEYIGQSTHLTYLGPLFEETLRSDTGTGGTVAQVIDGTLNHHALTGMAGIANIGTDRDWSGSTFNQADWYAFGRFAWDPQIDAKTVAREWAAQTFDPRATAPVTAMMMGSREAAVDYMTPLGLAHVMGTGHHYGPAPWIADLARPEWNPVYYHKADAAGIGFDRTATGSDAVAQYAPPVAARLSALSTTPEREWLWFHHVGWDQRLASGETLWDGLVHHYDRGVAYVGQMQATWNSLRPLIDAPRFAQTQTWLAIQHREAQWWRDASIAYFQSVSKRPLPAGAAAPEHTLDWYKAQRFPYAPGNP